MRKQGKMREANYDVTSTVPCYEGAPIGRSCDHWKKMSVMEIGKQTYKLNRIGKKD